MVRVEMNNATAGGVRVATYCTSTPATSLRSAVATPSMTGTLDRTGRKLRTGETVKYAAMTRI